MDSSGLTSIYAYYNPYGLYGLGGLSSLGAVAAANRSQGSSSVSGIGGSSSWTTVSSLGQTLSAVSNLQTAAEKLTKPGAFSSLSVASSSPTVARGSAAEGTAQGAYTVRVDQLAQQQVLTSAAQATQYTAIGSGADTTVNFQFANGRSASVDIDGGDNTVKGLAAAINRADIGVSASVVSGPTGYQLQLSGESGAGNAFTVSASGDSTLSDFFSSPPGGNGLLLTQQAQDAKGSVNGSAFTSGTNTATTSVEGLTLKLNATGTTNLTVGGNADQASAVTDFVKAYNAVQSGLNSLSREYAGFNLTAPYLRNTLSQALTPGAAAGSGNIQKLADIGISSNANGSLSVDTEKLRSALSSNADAVASLFSTDKGEGVADRILAQVSEDGALAVDNLLKSAAPSLTTAGLSTANLQSNLLNAMFNQQQNWLSQYSGLGSLTASLGSTDSLLSSLLGSSSNNLSGLGLIGGLSNPATVTSLFSS